VADVTSTIGSGGDYATVTLWEASATVSTGFWKGEIEDNAEFNENVTIAGITGTPTIANRVWLTAQSAVRHDGTSGSGARMRGSSNGNHVITISEDFTQIENIEIQQDSTGTSDEAIRITSAINDVLISRCILWTDQGISDQDGIYTGDWAADAVVDNCVIYGFRRAGIHVQNFLGSAQQDWDIHFCTINDCGDTSELESGGIHVNNPGGDVNIAVYNTGCFNTRSTYDDFSESGGGTTNWSGTNNASSDASLTNLGIATNAQESLTLIATTQSSGSYFVVTNLTAGSEDYKLLDGAAGNLAFENGITRVGSEPDTRQDFALDLTGQTRSTSTPGPDIGCDEFIAVVSSGLLPRMTLLGAG